MADPFELLQQQVTALKVELGKQPRFKRGQITSVSPLRVKFDGSPPLSGEPDCYIPRSSLAVNDYVDVRLQGTRAIIVGATSNDTDWLPLVPEPGFTADSARVRRVGDVLYFKGSVRGSLAAGVTTRIAVCPFTLSDTNRQVATSTSDGQLVSLLTIEASTGVIRARNPTAVTDKFISLSPLSGTAI